MVCEHLKELYHLCETQQLRFCGADLVRIVCKQCQLDETCPSVLYEEYEAKHPEVAKGPQKEAEGE
jgi:hypothetical protein